jgi:hypothetical protein
MRHGLYLPGANKRLFRIKIKRFLSFSCIFTTILVVGISGNVYLKTKSDTSSKMTLNVSAMATDIENLKKERDDLLNQIKESKKVAVTQTPSQSPVAPTPKPILNKKIRTIAYNLEGEMTGHSTYLYNKCLENNLDALMVAAIIKHESANGTSVAIRRQNNIAGFMGSRGLMTFDSIRDSIDFMVILLRTAYIEQGLTTLEKIQPKYCPIGAKNDPTGLNKHWLPTVRSFYRTMVEESV